LSSGASVVDLTDPDLYEPGVPHAEFARLRAESPVYWHPEPPPGKGFWAITKHADIVDVSKRHPEFSTAAGFVLLEDLEPDAMAARRSMIETDPPEHTRLRRLVSPLFTPRAIREWEGRARTVANDLLDRALERDSFDWATDVCEPLPISVFVAIMGIDDDDAPVLARLANQLITVDDPELAPPPEAYERVRARGIEPRLLPFRSPAALDLFDFGRDLADQRRRDPKDDLITRLIQAEWDGDHLTDSEFVNFFQLLIFAGNETTRTSLQQGMLAFVDHPAELERLRAAPGLMPNAVEEILRWATPIYYFRRTALADTQIGDVPIRNGDKIIMYYISGNYDEEVFPDPLRFDVSREPPGHVVFGGGGIHYCLGAWLARMQVRVLFEEFLARNVVLEPTGPVRRLRSNFTNGLKSLPVRAVPR
jgi:cholest-4-en-3-one 26-monooxygenase